MKKINVLQTEVSDLKREKKHLEDRLANVTDESAKLFLQNLINYNEETITNLLKKLDELSK